MHPGYGFLSENEAFMTAITEAGVAWLGPTAKTMHDFSLKHVAREIARNAQVRSVRPTRKPHATPRRCECATQTSRAC